MPSHRGYDPALLAQGLAALTPVLLRYLTEAQAGHGKVLVQRPVAEILEDLDFQSVVEDGQADLAALTAAILEHSNHLADPRYIGHQVAVPMVPSALADLVSGLTNNGMPIYEMGPAATAIERGMIRWLLDKVGWQDSGDGVMTHGGSLANLTCLLAARARALPQAWEEGPSSGAVLLASAASHYSIARAAAIMGLGRQAVQEIPVDGHGRIRVADLKILFDRLQDAGKKVVAVVINACVTATGVYDPIYETACFCRRRNAWLHVDGAHGASALLAPQYRSLLAGIELADSLTWDTHKMLGTSTVCGVALFRQQSGLAQTFAQSGSYLFAGAGPGPDVAAHTVECTKQPLAMKLFFNLAVMGEAGLASHVAELFQAARAFYDRIVSRPGFVGLCPPEANVFCFAYGDSGELQDRIRQALVAEGDFYITRATVDGRSYLRLAVMNPFTSAGHIDALCQRIEALAEELTLA
ncbi:MAG: aminotransferase class V-fold PLP-dependent enzyme [Thermodesulfobacteriota bacterium]